MLKWFISLFVKKTNLVVSEGKAKFRVKGWTFGLFISTFCVAGVWVDTVKKNSVGLVWFNQGYRLIAEVEKA